MSLRTQRLLGAQRGQSKLMVALVDVRFPLSLRNVEDLLFERGIDICHETVRFWWNRFGPLFAGDIRRQRVSRIAPRPSVCSVGSISVLHGRNFP